MEERKRRGGRTEKNPFSKKNLSVFFAGMFSAFELFPNIDHLEEDWRLKSEQSDWERMSSDQKAIGGDFRKAVSGYRDSLCK